MNWKKMLIFVGGWFAATAMIGLMSDPLSAQQRRERVKAGVPAKADIAENALKVYVPPGDFDEYYAFLSGGHSGQVYVYGLPSMRHIRTIPVFSPYAAIGYGYDVESKKMLGEFTWGDTHHPGLSETKGE